jgi:AcrR family transcriptional regulator
MTAQTVAPTAPRPLRADAARNRVRILQAAQEVFAERGLDATLDDVAHHAGVGVGTVYRRFADRQALVDALFDERLQQHVERAEAALADEDAWRGLVTFLHDVCSDLAADRGLRQVMLCTGWGQDRVAAARERITPLGLALVGRAAASGALRPGIGTGDLPVLFLMMSTVADFAGEVAPDLWERYFAIVVDGLAARPGQDALHGPQSLDDDSLAAAMCSFHAPRR